MPQIITTDVTSATYSVLTGNPDDFTFIAAGVLVSTTSPAFPAYAAVGVFHDNNTLGVAGTVFSGAAVAVYSTALNSLLTVTATGSILSMSTSWSCVAFFGSGAQIFNDGAITGLRHAVISSTFDLTVFNTGLISGGIVGVGGATLVENLGTIRGTIAVEMGPGDDRLINAGTLIGNVSLFNGGDLFDGIGGRITGTVDGGGGDDVFRLSDPLVRVVELAGGGIDRIEATVGWDLGAAAEVEDLTLLGGADLQGIGNALANQVRGNSGANLLFGLDGNDTLSGLGGHDRLEGGLGNDSCYGGLGDDRVMGRAGDDRLEGGSEEDRLFGGAGFDTLGGGDGDDLLAGGAGRDVLNGGLGEDVFVYQRVSDTGLTGATRDTVQDFTADQDRIDLSPVDANSLLAGDQAFAYIGSAAFSGVPGQLRLVVTGADGVLEGEVDGVSGADFRIALSGVSAVAAADLIL